VTVLILQMKFYVAERMRFMVGVVTVLTVHLLSKTLFLITWLILVSVFLLVK